MLWLEDDGCRQIPIHHAARNMSPEFLKLLLNNHPEYISVRDSGDGSIPFHGACFRGRLSTVAYLFEVYPETTRVRDVKGFLPKFLLKQDPESASTTVSNGRGRWSTSDEENLLPLHLACANGRNLNTVKLLFDALPEAIFAKDRNGRDLIDIARSASSRIVAFLQTQLSYALKVEDELAMTTPNENGELLLHHLSQCTRE